jgi:hypothetical protein
MPIRLRAFDPIQEDLFARRCDWSFLSCVKPLELRPVRLHLRSQPPQPGNDVGARSPDQWDHEI